MSASRLSAIAFFLVTPTLSAQATAPLPELHLTGPLTVSGLSSGGYMAVQFHLAFSDLVDGAGVIAAGPWGCAQNSLVTALADCLNKDKSPDLAVLRQQLDKAAAASQIHDLKGVKQDKVFLLHGQKDLTVHQNVTDSLAEQYRQLAADVLYIKDMPFAHHFPTERKGNACDTSTTPFIGACNYDTAGILLRQLLGPLQLKSQTMDGKLLTVDQQQLGGEFAKGLANEAYLFVPQSCLTGKPCRLHISFHGCKQHSGAVGDVYARDSGLNEWAASNQLVVLYPQIKASLAAPLNPNGCWDWWGYTGEDYATRSGEQPKAVLQMIKNLGYTFASQ